jgi:hypothetical protein
MSPNTWGGGGEDKKCVVLFTRCHSGDQIKNEIGRARSTYRGEKRFIQGVGGET